MGAFLTRFVVFTVVLILTWFAARSSANHVLNDSNLSTPNAIFVFGDSQTNKGIDLDLSNTLIDRNVLTAARHGAGVYDFAVFCDQIPANAVVIVGLSTAIQIRRPGKDYNRSGLSFNGLYSLYRNNFPLLSLVKILKNNLGAGPLFISPSDPFPVSDTAAVTDDLKIIKQILDSSPGYVLDKQNVIADLLDQLAEKHCTIFLVEFPLHPTLSEIFAKSPFTERITSFKQAISELPGVIVVDSLSFETSRNVMFDMAHLNALGRDIATRQIFEKINAHFAEVRRQTEERGKNRQ